MNERTNGRTDGRAGPSFLSFLLVGQFPWELTEMKLVKIHPKSQNPPFLAPPEKGERRPTERPTERATVRPEDIWIVVRTAGTRGREDGWEYTFSPNRGKTPADRLATHTHTARAVQSRSSSVAPQGFWDGFESLFRAGPAPGGMSSGSSSPKEGRGVLWSQCALAGSQGDHKRDTQSTRWRRCVLWRFWGERSGLDSSGGSPGLSREAGESSVPAPQ